MLVFSLQHRVAIDGFTADRNNDLRQYELDEQEWNLVEQLVEVLEVRVHVPFQIHGMICNHGHF